MLDYVIKYMTNSVGVTIPFQALFGIAVTLYLIGTEGFSVTRNLIMVGLPVPEYIPKVFGLIKDEIGRIIQQPKKAA